MSYVPSPIKNDHQRHPSFVPSPVLITRRSLDSFRVRRVIYVDRGVGSSPPPARLPHPREPTQPHAASLKIADSEVAAPPAARATATTAASTTGNTTHAATPPSSLEPARSIAQLAIKRHASDETSHDEQMTDANAKCDVVDDSPIKRARGDDPPLKVVPALYEDCDVRDLVILISSMLLELISYNDAIPLQDGHLTRFHSRAPPGISVQDYLQRLTTHATLSPPILLSMVYYIDRLCALYPAFTITSLTVHRFLIASATVASKGLSDSFWTNKTYAKVGGVSLRELGLLELDFLTRLEWKIVPKPEVLVDYYRSLVNRSETHGFDQEPA